MVEREVFPIQEEPEARTAKWYVRNRRPELPDKPPKSPPHLVGFKVMQWLGDKATSGGMTQCNGGAQISGRTIQTLSQDLPHCTCCAKYFRL